MAALLSSVVSNSEKTSLYIQECQEINVPVLPPSVNESLRDFTVIKVSKMMVKRGYSFWNGGY